MHPFQIRNFIKHKRCGYQRPRFPELLRVLIGTGRYIGEGFDDARLDTLFLTMPISWKGLLQQYAGRLHRLHHNKKEVQIYDYVDIGVPMLARMYDKRKAGYDALGYRVKDGTDSNNIIKVEQKVLF